MERKDQDEEVNADNNCISISANPLDDENMVENNNALVASRDEAADLNKPRHAIPSITIWCLITLVYPILSHVFDFVSDIRLAIDYFENQKTVHGSLTLAFVTLQAMTSAWISFLMHDPKLGTLSAEETNGKITGNWFKKMAKLTAHYSIVIMFQRALPICQLRKLWFAWRVRQYQQKKDTVLLNHYNRKMLEEDRDSAVLKVVACFLQSAPQLIFQLYILLSEDTAINASMWSKIITGSATLFGLGTAMKNYHCACRLAQPDKAEISKIGANLLLLWYLGTTVARIVTITIAASIWLSYTSLALVINWMGWTIWIYITQNASSVLDGNKTEYSSASLTFKEKIRNLILAGVTAVVCIFAFVNLGKGPTFVRNSIYHILCLLQNVTVVVLWFTLTNLTDESVWFSKGVLIFSVAFFFIGIAAMITYYMLFHPTLPKTCQIESSDCSTWV